MDGDHDDGRVIIAVIAADFLTIMMKVMITRLVHWREKRTGSSARTASQACTAEVNFHPHGTGIAEG